MICQRLHQVGFHHSPPVGYRIVEGERLERCLPHLIAYTQHRERKPAPLATPRAVHIGLSFTPNLKTQRLIQSHGVEAIHKILLPPAVVTFHKACHRHVRGDLPRVLHRYFTPAARLGIAYHPVKDSHLPVARIHRILEPYQPVLQQRNERG